MDQKEMEEMQRMSDKYQPDLPGPLIGDKLPMSDLVQEYVKADPTYVAKTQALAASHISYRRVKGDGQCGWRGAVFRYFEVLAESNDPGLIQQEDIRIRTFEDVMKMAGVQYDLLEDFFEQTWGLFEQVRNALMNGTPALPLVVDAFNDDGRSNAIVYHFKMMTSSYMALHADDFEPFLEMPLDQYRQARIDPTNQEIDQIGLQALSTGVLAPAGLAVEVLYLDRSAGEAATPHAFVPGGEKTPTVRLLYRPGHYDLIYKIEPIDPVTMNATGSFARSNAVQHVDDTLSDDRYIDFLFPQSRFLPSHETQNQYDEQPVTDYSYHSQGAFQPSHAWDPSSMYGVPPYSMPTVSATNYYQPEAPSRGETPAYYPSPPETYQSASPSNPVSSASSSSVVPSPCVTEPAIRHSEFSSVIRGPRRRPFASIPLDPRSIEASSQSRANFTNPDFEPEAWDPRNPR